MAQGPGCNSSQSPVYVNCNICWKILASTFGKLTASPKISVFIEAKFSLLNANTYLCAGNFLKPIYKVQKLIST